MIKKIVSFVEPLRKLPSTVIALAFVSMLSNVSSVVVSSLTPTLVIVILGGDIAVMGVIRGSTEALAFLVKLFSGMLSDYIGKRKILVVIGYASAVLVKPIFATARSIFAYAFAQTVDRVTNGLRDAPRDALVSDAAPKSLRGSSFGLRQALSAFGSAIGGVFGYVAMNYLGGEDTEMVRGVYWLTMIPLSICLIVLIMFVHDNVDVPKLKDRGGFPIKKSDLDELGGRYRFFMFAIFVFMAARSSESFLIYRALEFGLPVQFSPLVLSTLYLLTAVVSHFVGIISDTLLSRKTCVLIGFMCLFVSYIFLAIAEDYWMVFAGVFVYGCHYGAVQTALFAMVSDYTPKHIKGTSFGILNLISAVGMIIASFAQGFLWREYGASFTYYISAVVVAVSIALFAFVKPEFKE